MPCGSSSGRAFSPEEARSALLARANAHDRQFLLHVSPALVGEPDTCSYSGDRIWARALLKGRPREERANDLPLSGEMRLMNIDDTIREVERLYQSVTGNEVPPESETPFATIPPEVDPQRYVEAQVERLTQLLGSQPGMGVSPTAPMATTTRLGATAFVPPLSVLDGEKERVYRLDVPGVRRKDVEVSLMNGALVVRGMRAF